MPGSYSENAVCSSIMRAATAWNVLDRAGVPGITDVWCPPVQAGINLLIQMKQSYRGQAKQAANAIWGSSAAHVRYKHITVVDDDIDIHDYAAVDWAIAYRVNAGENDVVIMPSTFGAGLDPSTRKRDRNPDLFGTGKWNRVLIDATINLDYDPDPELGGARFPPTVWPEKGRHRKGLCPLDRTRSRQAERLNLKRLHPICSQRSPRARDALAPQAGRVEGCTIDRPPRKPRCGDRSR